jgi:hypothetical protein
MAVKFTTSCIEDSLAFFRRYERLAESVWTSWGDEQLCHPIDPESNSVAIIVKHMIGNMRSLWDRLSLE